MSTPEQGSSGTAPNAKQIIRRVFCTITEAIRVKNVTGLLNFEWDDFTIDNSDPLFNLYTYTFNGEPAGVIKITYTDTCKNKITRGQRL